VLHIIRGVPNHFSCHNWQPCISGFDQVPSRTSLLCDVERSRLVGGYRRFEKNRLQKSSSQGRIATVHIIMYIWNKAIYCTPLQSNLQGEQVILLEITAVTNQFYRWAVMPGSENILGPKYLPLTGALPYEWHYQKPSSHDGLYIVRTWSRGGYKVCLFCVTCVSVYCSLLVTNTDCL